MFIPETSQLPGQIEAALQYLRFAEEIQRPQSFDGSSHTGRDLTKTEFEVKDSALTMLLEYFNQSVPVADHRHEGHPSSSTGKPGDLPI